MADPEQYKSISVDIDTYNLLKTVADAECRTVGMQIRWMIKNGMVNPTSQTMPAPTVAAPTSKIKVKRSKRGGKLISYGGTAEILLRLYETNATLTARDFMDIAEIEDPSGALYNLARRGDAQRLGDDKPHKYHITAQGTAKAREIIRRRENDAA
mgnify:FL=1|tara:strand:- start:4523 stop:4987 length:465 start_codon:yes stop_codon:yes gene_type:complete